MDQLHKRQDNRERREEHQAVLDWHPDRLCYSAERLHKQTTGRNGAMAVGFG